MNFDLLWRNINNFKVLKINISWISNFPKTFIFYEFLAYDALNMELIIWALSNLTIFNNQNI